MWKLKPKFQLTIGTLGTVIPKIKKIPPGTTRNLYLEEQL